MCGCLSRTTWGRETQHSQKKKRIVSSAVPHTHEPHRLPSGITAEPPKCFLSLLQSLWGRGGLGPAQSQLPEKLPLPRNPANQSPFQNIVLLEPKLEDFYAPSRKGNVENSNRVKENAKRNLTDIPRGCRESPKCSGELKETTENMEAAGKGMEGISQEIFPALSAGT